MLSGQVGRVHDRGGASARGAALLECVLALALFVAAGMAVLAMVDHAMDSIATTRDAERAADLARSAMARIEAGLATPDTLNGPVKADQDGQADGGLSAGTDWSLEVQTEPSQFQGLTNVSVRAYRQAEGSPSELASFTLHQLVRLTEQSDKPSLTPATTKGRRSRP